MLFGPGDGFKAAMRGINMARTFVGAGCCGMLHASLKTALAYGAKRHAFGKPILSFQGLQWELADVATDLEAARLLTYRAAATLDRGENAVAEAAHAKKFRQPSGAYRRLTVYAGHGRRRITHQQPTWSALGHGQDDSIHGRSDGNSEYCDQPHAAQRIRP